MIHPVPGAIYPDDYNFDLEMSAIFNGESNSLRNAKHVDRAKLVSPERVAGLALAYQDLKKRFKLLEAAHQQQTEEVRQLRADRMVLAQAAQL